MVKYTDLQQKISVVHGFESQQDRIGPRTKIGSYNAIPEPGTKSHLSRDAYNAKIILIESCLIGSIGDSSRWY